MSGRSPSGRATRASTEPRVAPGLGHSASVPNAALSAWSERRPPRTEQERAIIADELSSYLPKPSGAVFLENEDIDALKAAFIRRFDEDLPRTETLFAVALIGYRLALRDYDLAQSA